MIYAAPGAAGAKIQYQAKYDNFIGGKWVAPVKGQYFDVISPINGRADTKAARSGAEDIERALDAAHAADPARAADGRPAELVYADRVEAWVVRLVPGASPLLRKQLALLLTVVCARRQPASHGRDSIMQRVQLDGGVLLHRFSWLPPVQAINGLAQSRYRIGDGATDAIRDQADKQRGQQKQPQ